jgi:hypothetical protein
VEAMLFLTRQEVSIFFAGYPFGRELDTVVVFLLPSDQKLDATGF